jgi:hypothetical protein
MHNDGRLGGARKRSTGSSETERRCRFVVRRSLASDGGHVAVVSSSPRVLRRHLALAYFSAKSEFRCGGLFRHWLLAYGRGQVVPPGTANVLPSAETVEMDWTKRILGFFGEGGRPRLERHLGAVSTRTRCSFGTVLVLKTRDVLQAALLANRVGEFVFWCCLVF